MSTDASTNVQDAEFETESGILATFKELRHSATAMGGALIVGVLLLMAIFSTIDLMVFHKALISSVFADPHKMNTLDIYAPPSVAHPMGTDQYGRDVLARVIYGSRIALAIGIIAVGIGFLGGIVLGSFAAYEGGYVDDAIMRALETLYSIPGLVLAMTLMAILGASIYNLFFAYGVIGIPAYARVIRSEVLSIREEEYVDAARAAGLSNWKILFREIIPNGLAAALVQATLSMGGVIIGAAALSFLGFGVQPPTASWGRMLNTAQSALIIAPWVAVFPGLMIFITVMGFNMLGDGLRDAMDPRTSLRSPDLEALDEYVDRVVDPTEASPTGSDDWFAGAALADQERDATDSDEGGRR
ncbi:MAG: ABC transporter permease [Haloferacaceae archaeon]